MLLRVFWGCLTVLFAGLAGLVIAALARGGPNLALYLATAALLFLSSSTARLALKKGSNEPRRATTPWFISLVSGTVYIAFLVIFVRRDYPAAALLWLPVMFAAQVLIHEIGHYVAAKLSGLGVIYVTIGILQWPGPRVLPLWTLLYTLGAVGIAPVPEKARPAIMLWSAGILANAAAAVSPFLFLSDPFDHPALWAFCAAGTWLATISLVPYRAANGIESDGLWLYRALRRKEELRSRTRAYNLMDRTRRPRDWKPLEASECPSAESDGGLSLALMLAVYLDRHDRDSVEQILSNLPPEEHLHPNASASFVVQSKAASLLFGTVPPALPAVPNSTAKALAGYLALGDALEASRVGDEATVAINLERFIRYARGSLDSTLAVLPNQGLLETLIARHPRAPSSHTVKELVIEFGVDPEFAEENPAPSRTSNSNSNSNLKKA